MLRESWVGSEKVLVVYEWDLTRGSKYMCDVWPLVEQECAATVGLELLGWS